MKQSIFGGLHLTNGWSLFLTKKNGTVETNWVVPFDLKFRIQVLSRAYENSKARGIVEAEVKCKYRRPKLKSCSPWVPQLCCYQSLLSVAKRMKQLSRNRQFRIHDPRFIPWIRHLGHCRLLGNSLALIVLNKWYINFRDFGEGKEGVNFFPPRWALPFKYQVFHTNGKCSKASCQWKKCDGKALSETWKKSVSGEDGYCHVWFKIRSTFLLDFRKVLFLFPVPVESLCAKSSSSLLPRKIIEKNFELDLWASLHSFMLDYSLTLYSSSCHMNSTRSLEIKFYNLYCKTSVLAGPHFQLMYSKWHANLQWRGDWSDQKARKIGEIVSKKKNQWNYLSMNLSLLCMHSSWIIIENVNNEITNVIKIVMFLPAVSFVGFCSINASSLDEDDYENEIWLKVFSRILKI